MKKTVLSVLLMLCFIPSAPLFSGPIGNNDKASAKNNVQQVRRNRQVQRVCRLQLRVVNGRKVLQDRVTGRILRIQGNNLQRNRNNVVFLNGNRIVLNALRTAALINGRVVAVVY